MAATTAADIRDRIATVIKALTPALLAGDKFREDRYESADDFIAECESQPADKFRSFHAIESGDDEPPETSSGVEEERRSTFVVTVAYPKNARAGSGYAVKRYALIKSDQRQIERAIGMHGRANFSGANPNATWLLDGTGTNRVSGDACDYLVVTQRMAFVITW